MSYQWVLRLACASTLLAFLGASVAKADNCPNVYQIKSTDFPTKITLPFDDTANAMNVNQCAIVNFTDLVTADIYHVNFYDTPPPIPDYPPDSDLLALKGGTVCFGSDQTGKTPGDFCTFNRALETAPPQDVMEFQNSGTAVIVDLVGPQPQFDYFMIVCSDGTSTVAGCPGNAARGNNQSDSMFFLVNTPEPGMFGAVGLGMAALYAMLRRRRS